MKHIVPYSELKESVNRGSVILIKGAGPQKRLYATTVNGVSMIGPNAKMAFLSNEFYRVVTRDGRLAGIRINFRNEESLMKALNFRQNGQPSVVINNNKTPYHWVTSKHASLFQALQVVAPLLMAEGYVLEAVDSERETRYEMWNRFGIDVAKRTLNTVFFGNDQIDVISVNTTGTPSDRDGSNLEDGIWRDDWSVDFEVLDRTGDLQPYFDYFDDISKLIPFSMGLTSESTFHMEDGSWYEDIGSYHVEDIVLYLEGQSIKPDEELSSMIKRLRSIIYEMDEVSLMAYIAKAGIRPMYLS